MVMVEASGRKKLVRQLKLPGGPVGIPNCRQLNNVGGGGNFNKEISCVGGKLVVTFTIESGE